MKIKLAAIAFFCSALMFCSESNATDLLGKMLGRGGCGCEATPTCCDTPAPAVEQTCGPTCPCETEAPACGCEDAPACGCGGRQPVRGLLSKLRSGGCGCNAPADDCGCEEAPATDCGCEEAPAPSCGCEEAPACGCGGRKPVRGLLSKLRSGGCGCDAPADDCGCEVAPATDCGCEEAPAPAPAPAPSCGCEEAPACGCGGRQPVRGLLGKLRSGGCGCDAPADDCGCEVAPATDCGCEEAPAPAPAPAPSCGCEEAPACGCGGRQPVRGLLSKLRSGGCGCDAPADDCGCEVAPAPAPAPAPSCGCEEAPACGCGGRQPVRGLLGKLRSGGCGCDAPADDCGCEEVPATDCGCEEAPAPAPAPSCGCEEAPACGCGGRKPVRGLLSKLRSGGCGCEAPAGDCGCDAAPAPAPSCGCDDAPSCGCKLKQRKARCGNCGRSSCRGGCRLTLLNKLRGDRTVRGCSDNCGKCMPACPNGGCDAAPVADCGCGSIAPAMEYGTVIEAAPQAVPVAAPVTAPAAVPATIVPGTDGAQARPVVDATAFVVRQTK